MFVHCEIMISNEIREGELVSAFKHGGVKIEFEFEVAAERAREDKW